MKCDICDKLMPYHREGKCYDCRHPPKTTAEKIIIGVTILEVLLVVFARNLSNLQYT